MIQLIASLIESDIVTFLQQENDVNSVLHFIQNKWSSHMLVIRTVCGNGIGSSLMAANNVKRSVTN